MQEGTEDAQRPEPERLGRREKAALVSWLSFTATFGTVRYITHSIRKGKGPFGNLSVGGEHLHHYMWGIGLLAAVGAVAVNGDNEQRDHPAVAISYGAGCALIVDEFALLLDLQDVYWAQQGRLSVDIGVGAVAMGGTGFSLIPVARHYARRNDPARRRAVDR